MRIDEFVFGKKNTSDATAKVKQYVQKNKAELNKGQDEKVGGTIGKIAAGSLARDTNVAAQRERNVGLDAFGGTGADKTPTPMDAGEFAGTPVAKPTAVAKPNTPPPGTPVAKPTAVAKPKTSTPKTPTPMDAGEFAGTPVAKAKKSAIVNKNVKAGQTADAAGEFGSAKAKTSTPKRARSVLPRASTSSVAGTATSKAAQDKFNQRQPKSVAKKTKKPSGTIGDMSDEMLNARK